MKRYTYISGATNKTEDVIHYLTPDNLIVRGKKQVYDRMLLHGTYNSEDFGLFHFNKKIKVSGRDTGGLSNWSEWTPCEDLTEAWLVRHGSYKYQNKVQYKSPVGQIFLSRFLVVKFLRSGEMGIAPRHKKRALESGQQRKWRRGEDCLG